MSIKLMILKSGENIVSEAKELVISDTEEVYGYLVTKPQKVSYDNSLFLVESSDSDKPSVKVSLSPWIILSKDDDILIPKDWVVTIVNPIENLEKMYLEQTNGSAN